MQKLIWGVDSAAAVNEQLLQCVRSNFGQPDVWGRYLNTIENVSEGLTRTEISFLKNNGIKVMPIYNNFRSAVGYQAGRIAAQNAIYNAQRVGIDEGVFIFANVERFFEVDADWIIAWVERFYNSNYRPGIYNDPTEGPFNEAYCQAAERSDLVREQTVLWSAEPEVGISAKTKMPRYNPVAPNCGGNVWAWQYGRDADECPIDTILVQERLFSELH
ncbi:glycoside hydrolase domain-containing protein [Evansella cellulosilytica]|uniref:Rv2525c-like glycoside hydrolase-like domain-containing protein n=1 Tax=Evansella cellulosilytica (strain ATCC 21833 / DSM 2522 / FERM P-1141 / JCM 9156 / N-4) TaxID=649639 RepID=E6TX44_EVAC2|nr:glycoside hydrolase domain-containing protein [Evansella cellulosilytica]ADU31133.1 Domain of unknown function DUF1906 [Evansella cellulosilytica DSM 2522]